MTIQLGIPAAVTVVGALVHLSTSGKWAELGRLSFVAGLLGLLL